uniref:Uncharacterized protein n=1 Tax=viral metagenome TaxID=1070528 RepID=A0A2V0RBU5_9ZZZZ
MSMSLINGVRPFASTSIRRLFASAPGNIQRAKSAVAGLARSDAGKAAGVSVVVTAVYNLVSSNIARSAAELELQQLSIGALSLLAPSELGGSCPGDPYISKMRMERMQQFASTSAALMDAEGWALFQRAVAGMSYCGARARLASPGDQIADVAFAMTAALVETDDFTNAQAPADTGMGVTETVGGTQTLE